MMSTIVTDINDQLYLVEQSLKLNFAPYERIFSVDG